MSQMLTSGVITNPITNPGTFTPITPIIPRSTISPGLLSSNSVPLTTNIVPSNTIPLAATPMASASMTGLVSPNSNVVLTSTPITVPQTINSSIPPSPRSSFRPPSPSISLRPPSPSVSFRPPSPSISLRPPSPGPSSNVQIPSTLISTNPVGLIQNNSPLPRIARQPSPSARTAIQNLSSSINPIKISTPISGLPETPIVEIMDQGFEVRDYQGIIANASIENELLNAGYAPLSKIVVRTDNGEKRTQYIKAINKNGQKVFILLDANGYTTARTTDLTLIEANSASIVPYSLKSGAYDCAGKDVCGVAFECGSDAVCVLSRGSNDLTPKEANFVFVEQRAPSAASLEINGSIMTYPVVRLTEIRTNPILVLANTDMVTRRLRNTSYQSELQDLASLQQSINKLNAAVVEFSAKREIIATKLYRTLIQLEQWNDIYKANPPTSDEYKEKYRQLLFNLTQRNENISTLLRLIKKVADKRTEVEDITKEINEIIEFSNNEFANIEYAITE